MIVQYVGTLSQPALNAITQWVTQNKFTSVQGLCSGSLRQEAALRRALPDTLIRANDVNLQACIAGRYLAGDDHAGLEFVGDWAPLNDARSRALAAAALHRSLNAYRKRYKPDAQNVKQILTAVEDQYDSLHQSREWLALDAWVEKDFLDVAFETDCEAILGSVPTFAGDYERWGKKLGEYVSWEQPKYRLFDPTHFPNMIEKLREHGKPWLMAFEYFLPQYKELLLAIHRRGTYRTVYLYGEPGFTSFSTFDPQRYALGAAFPKTIRPEDITIRSRIDIHPVDGMTFSPVEHAYHHNMNLQPLLDCFFVLIDGKLAGGFATLAGGGQAGAASLSRLYIASDFAWTGDRRLSKLIPMLSRSNEVRTYIERRRLYRYPDGLTTMVFKPGQNIQQYRSMKYRGTGWTHVKAERQNTNILSYHAPWAEMKMTTVFRDWYRRHADK